PISQAEFYELFAFFNNADEPEIEVPQEEVKARQDSLAKRIAKLEAKRIQQFPIQGDDADSDSASLEERRRDALNQSFTTWREQAAKAARRWELLDPTEWSSKN